MSSHSISLMLRHAFKGPQEVCELSPEKPALVPPDEELMELVHSFHERWPDEILAGGTRPRIPR